MKRTSLLFVAAVILAACAPVEEQQQGGGQSCAPDALNLKTPDQLTVGTSYPYYEPFKDGPRQDPEGFEPDLAAELAEHLGVTGVGWAIHPFDSLYAPGTKDYDFAMDQISVSPEREEVIDFSDLYYPIQQGLLVRAGDPIADASTLEELQQYRFGAETGTTGLDFIEDTISPDEDPNKYSTTNDAATALDNGQIDGVVIDVPIAIPIADRFGTLEVAAQFITNEGYGLAFTEPGSELLPCVNQALAEMRQDGTLRQLQDEWLPDLNIDIPVIEYPGQPKAA
jgi:polar amino acid transport system substrate-binding protein